MKRLTGEVAIVSGACSGIGTGIARRLSADGAAVVVNYARREKESGALVAI